MAVNRNPGGPVDKSIKGTEPMTKIRYKKDAKKSPVLVESSSGAIHFNRGEEKTIPAPLARDLTKGDNPQFEEVK